MKKIISCLILCAMLLSVFPMSVFANETESTEKTVSITDYKDATNKTTEYPFDAWIITISDAAELETFNTWTGINNTQKDNGFKKAYIRIENDIDYTGKTWKGIVFDGTFDGNGHTISNLTVSSTARQVAMFRFAGGTIKNLTLLNIIADASDGNTNTNGSTSRSEVGAVVGSRANVNAYESNLIIENVHVVNGTVKGADKVGGIIGSSSGINNSSNQNTLTTVTIRNCSFVGNVSATGKYVGGIIGFGAECGGITISDCYIKGDISNIADSVLDEETQKETINIGEADLGGIIGCANMSVSISGCTVDAISIYSKNNTTVKYMGGVIGRIDGDASTASICDTVVTGTISCSSDGIGGIISFVSNGANVDIDRCYVNANIKGAGNRKGGVIGVVQTGSTAKYSCDINIKDCLVTGTITTGDYNTHSAGIIGITLEQTHNNVANTTSQTFENIIVSIVPSHAHYAAFAKLHDTQYATEGSTRSYKNVWYDIDKAKGVVMFCDNLTPTSGTQDIDYGAKTTEEINALTLTGWNDGMPVTLTYTDTNGFQCKDNNDGTVDYRVVGTLTLPAGKTLENIADIGFYVTFTYSEQTIMQKVSCKKVYSSVTGGGITYYAGERPESDTDESHEYIGGDYIFVLVIENVPEDVVLDARFTSYVNVSNTNGCDAYHEVTEIHTLSKN